MSHSPEEKLNRKDNLADEYLIGWSGDPDSTQDEIFLYGNSEGLRKLAEALNAVADFDQTLGAFPDHDSFHAHFVIGANTVEADRMPRITIGRVEHKHDSAKIRAEFPAIDPDKESGPLLG